MNKLYRDAQGIIYAYNAIQTPKEGLVELTKKETEALLNPQPTSEQLAEQGRDERDSALRVLDTFVSNPLRYTGLTEDQKTEAAAYRQALLDVPQQEGFPQEYVMPEVPDFLIQSVFDALNISTLKSLEEQKHF